MRAQRWAVVATLCLLASAPTLSMAQARDQAREEADNFVEDVLWAIFGPNWNLFANAGATTSGRYMLVRPVGGGGDRALKTDGGWNVGLGGGVDILLRAGWRTSYTYTSSDLEYRTDNGDGSTNLDVDDVAGLRSHTVALEFMRYLLPPRLTMTPYATAGFVGTWWVLDEDGSTLVDAAGGSTQFRLGAIGSVGFQMHVTEHWLARIEMAAATVRSPFTGKDSFRTLGDEIVDEPGRVQQTDFRLVGVYSFGKPEMPRTPTASRGRPRR